MNRDKVEETKKVDIEQANSFTEMVSSVDVMFAMLGKKSKIWLASGAAALVILVAIGGLWHAHHCDTRFRNNRLLLKSFYFTGKESETALKELESSKVNSTLTHGQRELVHLKNAAHLAEKRDFQGALSELEEVLEDDQVPELQALALMRSVRLLIELKLPAKGIKLMKQYSDKLLSTLTASELWGDLYYAQGNLKKARSYYLKAWESNSSEDSYRRLLLKLLNV